MSRSRRRILHRRRQDIPNRHAMLTEKHPHKGGKNWLNRITDRIDRARWRRADRWHIREQLEDLD